MRFIDLSLVDARAIGNFKVDPQSYSGDKLAAYIGWVSINKKRKKRKRTKQQKLVRATNPVPQLTSA